jgi:membrane protease YdiL (CAAX protease family)
MLGQITDYGFRQTGWVKLHIDVPLVHPGFLVRLVTFMGAGIYEEFLFRLCLLPTTYMALRALMAPKRLAIAGTIITTSLIFSLAHYLSPRDDGQILAILTDAMTRVASTRQLWFGFVFRTVAGIFFAGLCFLRGFGITVGAHAFYDIFVGVVLITEV